MKLRPAALPSECQAAITTFQHAHGVVDFAVFDAPNGIESEALHLSATLEAYARFCAAALEEPERTAEPRILETITVAQFLGTLETSEGTFDQPGALLEAQQAALKARKGFSYGLSTADGFVYAFACPPYSLSFEPTEAQRTFDAICEVLFGSFRDDLEIARWSNDWSWYFDAGHEWWGAFWWTIHNRTRDIVVVVAASSTD